MPQRSRGPCVTRFKDDDYILKTLTAEGAKMAINEWEVPER